MDIEETFHITNKQMKEMSNKGHHHWYRFFHGCSYIIAFDKKGHLALVEFHSCNKTHSECEAVLTVKDSNQGKCRP